MQIQNGFTKIDTPDEFESWLKGQKVTRKIKLIQIHHTATRLSTFKKINHFTLQQSMKNFHVKNNGFVDIAQQFTIFPDGTIVTGRSLNTNPAGITGANTGAICIENYGWFDKNYDIMPQAQKNAIIKYVAILCKHFKLTPSANTIVYHCWYTAKGQKLNDYVAGKSCKTCPGSNFFGGNTFNAYITNFLPLVKQEFNNVNITNSTTTNITSKPANIFIDPINIKKGDPAQFSQIIKNIKKSLNTEFGLAFIINDSIDDVLLTNLGNIRLSGISYRANITFTLQQLLLWWGYSLTIDGIYGNNTINTVSLFQRQTGITADGTTTKEFWTKILGK